MAQVLPPPEPLITLQLSSRDVDVIIMGLGELPTKIAVDTLLRVRAQKLQSKGDDGHH